MIDTCDPTIAGWFTDGASFLVRDTDRFAKTVIPQFFKHNKWSSFVRQLNFYGFKKVKGEAVTVAQEERLEGMVQFRHEHFLRGRPDQLVEIQRRKMLAQQQAAANAQLQQQQQQKNKKQGDGAGRTHADNCDFSTAEDAASKSEVKALRDRITAMSKNIDNLATMVENMQVQDINIEAGSKRKKLGDSSPALLETPEGSVDLMLVDEFPDGCNNIDPSIVYTPVNIFPPASRQASVSSLPSGGSSSDEAFVDDLFAFNEEGLLNGVQSEHNVPDPRLMKELTDALTVLPREMQDNLVKGMISTIVGDGPGSLRSQLKSTSPAGSTFAAAAAAPVVGSPAPMVVVANDEMAAPSPSAMEDRREQSRTVVVAPSPSGSAEKKSEIALQIDSATFNALLEHLAKAQESKDQAGKPAKILPPIVSVH